MTSPRKGRAEPTKAIIAEWHDVDPDICQRCRRVARTERCHVIDRQFGGLDTPANLALLCPPCHKEQPVFVPGDERRAWMWVNNISQIAASWETVQTLRDEAPDVWDRIYRAWENGEDVEPMLATALAECGLGAYEGNYEYIPTREKEL